MKTTIRSFSLIACYGLGFLLAGCGQKSDSPKPPGGGGRLFGVSFQTMNNPFFVDLIDELKKSIEPDDFDYAPFSQRGGLGKAHQLFGEQLPSILDELNLILVA